MGLHHSMFILYSNRSLIEAWLEHCGEQHRTAHKADQSYGRYD